MFKKSLAVLAVLGAFAGVSSAAEVTLYGRVDAGLQYQHIDQDEANVDDDDNFAMKSGFTTGSRWGMKGTEDLGNGMTVGFVLENGFNVDDGSLADSDRLFNRESQVFVRSNFGELSFGRVGQLNSGNVRPYGFDFPVRHDLGRLFGQFVQLHVGRRPLRQHGHLQVAGLCGLQRLRAVFV